MSVIVVILGVDAAGNAPAALTVVQASTVRKETPLLSPTSYLAWSWSDSSASMLKSGSTHLLEGLYPLPRAAGIPGAGLFHTATR